MSLLLIIFGISSIWLVIGTIILIGVGLDKYGYCHFSNGQALLLTGPFGCLIYLLVKMIIKNKK